MLCFTWMYNLLFCSGDDDGNVITVMYYTPTILFYSQRLSSVRSTLAALVGVGVFAAYTNQRFV